MERKYYLRGLGIGIAVTAIIMGIVTPRGRTMTNQEIIARAKELGMVENTVLADMVEEEPAESGNGREDIADTADASDLSANAGESVAGQTEEDVKEPEAGKPEEETAENRSEDGMPAEEKEADEETDMQESGEETADEIPDEADKVTAEETDKDSEKTPDVENARDTITSAAVKTITINSGDGSHTVAKKLADAGVVTSADTFDEFLCQNGYDKRLRTGTFSIPADASDEQIARIVTGVE